MRLDSPSFACSAGIENLIRVPQHVSILDFQHFPEAASGLQRPDDAMDRVA
jgi:hypothetical protein